MSSQSGPPVFRRVAQYKSPQALRDRLSELECELPCDDEILTASDGSPLAEPIEIAPLRTSTSEILNLASVAAYSAEIIDYKK